MTQLVTPVETGIVERDLSAVPGYDALPGELDRLIGIHGDASTAYGALGRTGLLQAVWQVTPATIDTLRVAKHDLVNGLGAVVLHNTAVNQVDDETAQLLSITIG